MIALLLLLASHRMGSDTTIVDVDLRSATPESAAAEWIAFDSKLRLVDSGRVPATLHLNLPSEARVVCALDAHDLIAAHVRVTGSETALDGSAHCLRVVLTEGRIVLAGVRDPRLKVDGP